MSKPEPDNRLDEVDRLSELPEPLLLHILSFVPTKFAIRTSVLSHLFRRLWTASPSMDLDRCDFPPGRLFTDASTRCFRLRDPSAPLVRFSLKSCYSGKHIPVKSALKWLDRAHSLGLRDLSLDIHTHTLQFLFPHILSFHSLQSLSVNDHGPFVPFLLPPIVPPTIRATSLKSLHLKARLSSSDLKRLITEQNHLEYLCLESHELIPDLVSPTVKKMKLIFRWLGPKIRLFFPALESLDFSVNILSCLQQFHVEMPLLKKAELKIPSLSEDSVPVLGDMFRCFCNVSELSLCIENAYPKDPEPLPGLRRRQKHVYKRQFRLLIEPGKGLPTFPHLKSLKLSMCFHEDGISDLICFLQNTPVLETLQLYHVRFDGGWESKLPQVSEGNDQHAHFSNLHLGDRKMELVRLLCREGHHKKFKT